MVSPAPASPLGPCSPVLPCGPCGPCSPVLPCGPCGPCGPIMFTGAGFGKPASFFQLTKPSEATVGINTFTFLETYSACFADASAATAEFIASFA